MIEVSWWPPAALDAGCLWPQQLMTFPLRPQQVARRCQDAGAPSCDCLGMQALSSHSITTMVIEPGFVATDIVLHRGDLDPQRCIQPADVAQAALPVLPVRLSPGAVPLELVMRVVLSPYTKGKGDVHQQE